VRRDDLHLQNPAAILRPPAPPAAHRTSPPDGGRLLRAPSEGDRSSADGRRPRPNRRPGRYAAEEYAAAVSGLQKAGAAVEQRDYRQALSYAIDARRRAQSAIRQAGEGKATAQRTTDALLTGIVTRATELEARLKAAAAAPVPAKELRSPRAAVQDVRQVLQEARAAIGGENYEKAGELLASVRRKLDAATAEVEKIPQRPPRAAKSRSRT
jgi:hypothetical protein